MNITLAEDMTPTPWDSLIKTYTVQSIAPATRIAYAADLKLFFAWCSIHNLCPYPASPTTIAAFISSEAAHGTKPVTISRRVAAIRFHHEAKSKDSSPTHSVLVRKTLAGIKRAHKGHTNKKTPLTADKIQLLMQAIPRNNIIGKRDRALLLLGFAGAMRRSELLNLTVEDLEVTEEGITINIAHSKTDQEGKGEKIAIPANTQLGILEALLSWLKASKIESGYIWRNFRRGKKGAKVQKGHLTEMGFYKIMKKCCLDAGLDPNLYSPHSLRSGFITSGAKAGATIFKIMEVSRHKKPETVMGYIRDAKLFENHAGASFL